MLNLLRLAMPYDTVTNEIMLPAIPTRRYKIARIDVTAMEACAVSITVGDDDEHTRIVHRAMAGDTGFSFQLNGLMELGLNEAVKVTCDGEIVVTIHYLADGTGYAAPLVTYGSPFTWAEDEAIADGEVTIHAASGPITSYEEVLADPEDEEGVLEALGISVDPVTGEITGTPTGDLTETEVTIRVTGPGGTQDVVITVTIEAAP